ncbi:MAG: peptidoglycan bridge formation glycyltransferase FemA/FemB family protein [Candidatus Peribacteraceae bacterium]
MTIREATDQSTWDTFLRVQPWKPFLQSWTMGEVYRDIGQEPVRLIAEENGAVTGICFGHIVPAKRGKHLSIPYGPVISGKLQAESFKHTFDSLLNELKRLAKERSCSFIRMSPFWPSSPPPSQPQPQPSAAISSPLHLLAEHVWYLPLVTPDPWQLTANRLPARTERVRSGGSLIARTEAELLSAMRKTTRNLIRRAERDGVTVEASSDPNRDLGVFLTLHNETRLRHGFTPYTDALFATQIRHFCARSEASLYLARFQGEVIAASIHMHFAGETSYHHGASTGKFSKIPASYLLQWTAIQDARRRGDHIYNFWGIAPPSLNPNPNPNPHPFAGVSLFKTGFGGELLNLQHCFDIPLSPKYWLTYVFEALRRWRRGF